MAFGETFWAIKHGDPETGGRLYWCGYDRNSTPKDHRWDADVKKAIRFCRREDAERAGVGVAHGVLLVEVRLIE